MGQAYITIDNKGENEIHTYFGANHCLSPIVFEENGIVNLINESKTVVIMDPPLNTYQKIAKKCRIPLKDSHLGSRSPFTSWFECFKVNN